MTITQLEYLIAVVNCGSFSAAAERCFVTQPSLSTQIKNLEEELGVILLKRGEKPIIPTQAGIAIIEQAKKAMAEFHTIKSMVDDMSSQIRGSLTLGVIPTISPYILHKFIPKFVKKHPNLKVKVREMYTSQIITELEKGTIDIGLLAGGFTPTNIIVEEDLYKDRFYLYVGRENKLLGKQTVHINELNTEDLLLLPDGHCLRTQVLNLCDNKSNSNIGMMLDSGSLETILRMVDTSDKATIIPNMMLPFITSTHAKQVISFKEELKAERYISLAVSTNFYKKSIYNALKESILEATEFDGLI